MASISDNKTLNDFIIQSTLQSKGVQSPIHQWETPEARRLSTFIYRKKMKLKRYLVFEFEQYYPAGGWNDFVGSFDTLEEARKKSDWDCQIIDSETSKEVV